MNTRVLKELDTVLGVHVLGQVELEVELEENEIGQEVIIDNKEEVLDEDEAVETDENIGASGMKMGII